MNDISMRFIGSKENILSFIEESIMDAVGDVSGKVFADLFSGTCSVARHFKKKKAILITNDYLAFSYALQIAYIKNNCFPDFLELKKHLKLKTYKDILNYLNQLKCRKGFMYKEYTLKGSKDGEYQRNYFSEENAIRIDSIRMKIQEWYELKLIDYIEFNIFLVSLLVAVTKVSNTAGTYGAFLKVDDGRKYKRLELRPIQFIESHEQHTCCNKDIFNIINYLEGDILYLDPPYNNRQYPPYYHILETITLYDNPAIYGLTGRRPYKEKKSPFCIKKEAALAIQNIVAKAKFKHIFLSYSTDGLVSKTDLYDMLSLMGEVKMYELRYRRYKSNSNGSINKNALKEIVFYVRKK